MENEFVPFELAVKLKELGFDKECFKSYTEDARLIWFTKGKFYFPAPLWQQAFDWFREEKNCLGILDYYRINGKPDKLYFYNIDVYEVGRETEDKFKSYREAQAACIQKLIELVNN